MTDARLILASASKTRAQMLRSAGVTLAVAPAHMDENAVKDAFHRWGASGLDLAGALAEMKAASIGAHRPGQLVLGADQVLICDSRIYSKPETIEHARAQLLELRGKSHELISAVAIHLNGETIWRHAGRAQLAMRPFSEAFLDDYLARAGDLSSVGCYRLEGLGAQLFTQVQGDYFTVLGLPLLEVLGFLRMRRMLLE